MTGFNVETTAFAQMEPLSTAGGLWGYFDTDATGFM
jgi:hypothetical protein